MRFAPILFAITLCAAPAEKADALLAKALKAFQQNQESEKHWNWVATEQRSLRDGAGKPVEDFPAVTAESIIRSDGKRCNAVVSWGDGKPAYLAGADPDARCQAMDQFKPAFSIEALLGSSQSQLESDGTLLVMPDKVRIRSNDYATRCAASIRASVTLDAKTYFPRKIEGSVVEGGCDQMFVGKQQYDGMRQTGPLKSNFRKGASFRMEFTLQKDRFQNPANSYWLCDTQHYHQPWMKEAETLFYWGRQVRVNDSKQAKFLDKDIKTTAKEFGVDSGLRFDTDKDH